MVKVKSDSAQKDLRREANWYKKKIRDLQKDIDQKGVTYMATSSTGKEYEKDNPAAKLIVQYTRQRMAILKELGAIEKLELEYPEDADGDYY